MRSDKILVHVSPVTDSELVGHRQAQANSKKNYIKLSFRSGGQSGAYKHLQVSNNLTYTTVFRSKLIMFP